MREIKFRIWDDIKKEWLGTSNKDSLTFYGFHLVGECMTVQSPPIWALDKGNVVEQFIGLKDKNGKEIYEGDIIEWKKGFPRIIIFKNRAFRTVPLKKMQIEESYNEPVFNDVLELCEIIGNIHENPELLESNNA